MIPRIVSMLGVNTPPNVPNPPRMPSRLGPVLISVSAEGIVNKTQEGSQWQRADVMPSILTDGSADSSSGNRSRRQVHVQHARPSAGHP